MCSGWLLRPGAPFMPRGSKSGLRLREVAEALEHARLAREDSLCQALCRAGVPSLCDHPAQCHNKTEPVLLVTNFHLSNQPVLIEIVVLHRQPREAFHYTDLDIGGVRKCRQQDDSGIVARATRKVTEAGVLATAFARYAESQDPRSSTRSGRTVGPKRYRSIIFKPTSSVTRRRPVSINASMPARRRLVEYRYPLTL